MIIRSICGLREDGRGARMLEGKGRALAWSKENCISDVQRSIPLPAVASVNGLRMCREEAVIKI
jgi:hypothetical protein